MCRLAENGAWHEREHMFYDKILCHTFVADVCHQPAVALRFRAGTPGPPYRRCVRLMVTSMVAKL